MRQLACGNMQRVCLLVVDVERATFLASFWRLCGRVAWSITRRPRQLAPLARPRCHLRTSLGVFLAAGGYCLKPQSRFYMRLPGQPLLRKLNAALDWRCNLAQPTFKRRQRRGPLLAALKQSEVQEVRGVQAPAAREILAFSESALLPPYWMPSTRE
jgi:hypothetical protein